MTGSDRSQGVGPGGEVWTHLRRAERTTCRERGGGAERRARPWEMYAPFHSERSARHWLGRREANGEMASNLMAAMAVGAR